MTQVTAPAAPMTHRQVLESLSGLLVALFVAILSGTVVSSSLPRIISDLGGDQTAYTWVVTSTLLATTVSTPIWGKLSDLTNRKLLVQLALVIFVLGSALAGTAQDAGWLIVWRVFQGLGAGGLTALVQVIMSDIISPRERGRYMGFMGAVMAVGTAGGPLLGGFITDSALGWRGNFYVAIPVAIVALILIQVTLHLPKRRRPVSIDWLGIVLIAGGVSLLLIWVTFAGNQFDWNSWQTYTMVGGAVLALVLAAVVESRVKEPVIPLSLFKSRTFSLVVVASLAVGVALFGTSVFLNQYMQLSRGATPTESGLMTLPLVGGLLVSSTIVGAVISRTGTWKRFVVIGSVLLTVGVALMSTVHYDTPYGLLALYMVLMGAGIGMVMQNIVLAVQNTVNVSQIGAASASVAFFRSLGGAVGVSVLGAVLGSQVTTHITDGIKALGAAAAQGASVLAGGSLPELDKIPEPFKTIVADAYGHGTAEIFLIAIPICAVVILAVAFLPNIALGSRSGIEQASEQGLTGDAATAQRTSLVETGAIEIVDVATAEIGATPDAQLTGRASRED